MIELVFSEQFVCVIILKHSLMLLAKQLTEKYILTLDSWHELLSQSFFPLQILHYK